MIVLIDNYTNLSHSVILLSSLVTCHILIHPRVTGDPSDLSKVEAYYFIPMTHPHSLNDCGHNDAPSSSSSSLAEQDGNQSDDASTTTSTTTSSSSSTSCAEGCGGGGVAVDKDKDKGRCGGTHHPRTCSLKRHRSVSHLDLYDHHKVL